MTRNDYHRVNLVADDQPVALCETNLEMCLIAGPPIPTRHRVPAEGGQVVSSLVEQPFLHHRSTSCRPVISRSLAPVLLKIIVVSIFAASRFGPLLNSWRNGKHTSTPS